MLLASGNFPNIVLPDLKSLVRHILDMFLPGYFLWIKINPYYFPNNKAQIFNVNIQCIIPTYWTLCNIYIFICQMESILQAFTIFAKLLKSRQIKNVLLWHYKVFFSCIHWTFFSLKSTVVIIKVSLCCSEILIQPL